MLLLHLRRRRQHIAIGGTRTGRCRGSSCCMSATAPAAGLIERSHDVRGLEAT